jgi:dTDP-4-dehydrorhamnose reductase
VRILITGAGGQLGHDLTRALAQHDLHAYDHAGLDITRANQVAEIVEQVQPDAIVNAAAYNEVDEAEHNLDAAFAANGAGPAYLAGAANRARARLIHISTDYVFDGRKGRPYDENDSPNPLSVYGRSKYEGERRVLETAADACVLRTAWLYGHGGKNFVKAILAAADRGGPLKVVADQIGSPTSTADLAAAIRQLLERPARGLFHVANAGACSRFEFARAITGGRVEVLPITTAEAARPAPRPQNSSLISLRWASTGLPPLQPWQKALDEFLERRLVS